MKETVEAFASAYTDFDAANLDSEKMDAAHFFPREAVKAMGDLGVLGMTIPEEYGGSGFSSAAYCRMTETIAPLDASASIVVGAHMSIGLKPLLLFGNEEQKKKWLPSLATGKMVAAFCLTEPEAGSDAGSLRTTAVYDPATNEYVLNGTKQWISNGGFARFFSVFARIPSDTPEKDKHKEIACFAVVANEDGTLPGLSRGAEEKKLGLCASSTCQIIFENCRIPAGNLIGEKGHGFKVAVETLNTGRTSLGAGSVGGSKMMLKLAVAHATQRKQFKTRVADFEMIRHKITRMAATTYALESMVYLTAGLVDKGIGDYSLEGACCKVFGTEVLWQNINDGLQIAGGNGFMNEYPYGRALRDSRINMIFEGTNEILRLLLALSGMKELGDSLKEVQSALKSPLAQRGVLTEYAHKRLKGVITHDKLTKVHPSLAPEADQIGRYAGRLRERVRDDPAQARQEGRRQGVPAGAPRRRPHRPLRPDRDALARDGFDREERRGESRRGGRDRALVLLRGQAPHGREPQGAREEPRRRMHLDQRPRVRGGRLSLRSLGVETERGPEDFLANEIRNDRAEGRRRRSRSEAPAARP